MVRASRGIMRRLFLLLGLVLVSACGTPTGPGDQAEFLSRNMALWARRGPVSYQYTLARSCECLPEVTQPVTIVVRNQVVAERHYLTGAPVDPQYDAIFSSVPGLFDLIEQALNANAPGVAVRYNRQLGYPESIQIDWVAGTADDEVSYLISGFGPITP